MSDARAKAWATRRAKYGPKGHDGYHGRPRRTAPSQLEARALALIARLNREGALSEGQCCKALGLDRIEWRAICDAA